MDSNPLGDPECCSIFKEAVGLRMIPYHGQVWHEYRFNSIGQHDKVWELLEIYYELLCVQRFTAVEILQWCKDGNLRSEASGRVSVEREKFFTGRTFVQRTGKFRHNKESQGNWFKQAKHCLECDELQKRVLDKTVLEKRYPYLVFGMTLWDLRPWLLDEPQHEVFHRFGYAAAEYFEGIGLFELCAAPFKRKIELGETTEAKESQDRDAFLQGVVETLRHLTHTDMGYSLYKNLASFLGNVPNNRKESVWRLAHACSSGMDWNTMVKRRRFKGVAQTFGFDQLPLVTGSEAFVNEAGKNLQEAYIEAFEKSPIELLKACLEGRLQTYVRDVWREKSEGKDLHQGTLKALEIADARNKVYPPSLTELLG